MHFLCLQKLSLRGKTQHRVVLDLYVLIGIFENVIHFLHVLALAEVFFYFLVLLYCRILIQAGLQDREYSV